MGRKLKGNTGIRRNDITGYSSFGAAVSAILFFEADFRLEYWVVFGGDFLINISLLRRLFFFEIPELFPKRFSIHILANRFQKISDNRLQKPATRI